MMTYTVTCPRCGTKHHTPVEEAWPVTVDRWRCGGCDMPFGLTLSWTLLPEGPELFAAISHNSSGAMSMGLTYTEI